MATKIRLQRHGKKGSPFYHIVVADSRFKRDGRFIEKLGTYNPNTNPATIDLDFDGALNWVHVGAEMSDTARAILSYKGVLYKNHLVKGVKKGALKEADVEKKFEAWLKDKESKIQSKSEGLKKASEKEKADRLAAEKAVSDARAKAIAEKNTPAEEVVEEVAQEAPAAEAKEADETPKGEVKEEKAPEAKKADETPKGEVKSEEEPKEAKAESKEEVPAKDKKEEDDSKKEEKSAE